MEPLLATRWSRIQLSYIEHDLVLDAVVPDPLEVLGADVRIGVADDAFFGLGRDGPKRVVLTAAGAVRSCCRSRRGDQYGSKNHEEMADNRLGDIMVNGEIKRTQ
ncbi:unnamed protein product [Phytophthora lilii]|uniref:Unnamed protein product n=1 Tax=Phytophthora lilii TaxID=2077276 RepID=A0A9W6XTC3_9STRA|nr:unnamed protein product [Phytophthora lilii]